MIRNILVTGGSGRLGSFVCPYLKGLGYNVASCDIVPPKPGTPNVEAGIPFIKVDLLNIGDILKALLLVQADAVVHLGAIPGSSELQPMFEDNSWRGYAKEGRRYSYGRCEEDYTMRDNTMGTFYVLDACRRVGVKTVVAASSFFVYGMGSRISGNDFVPQSIPITEEHPCEPEDTYSLSKLLNEVTMQSFARAYDMSCIAMRLLGVYYHNYAASNRVHVLGRDYVIPKSDYEAVMTGTIYEYADARDIARFVGLVFDNLDKLPNKFEAFNVWTDTHFVPESADFYGKLYPKLRHMTQNLKGHEGLFSIEKARRLLGYEPAYSWRNEPDKYPIKWDGTEKFDY